MFACAVPFEIGRKLDAKRSCNATWIGIASGLVMEMNKPLLVVYAAAALAVAMIGSRYLKSAAGDRMTTLPTVATTGATGGV